MSFLAAIGLESVFSRAWYGYGYKPVVLVHHTNEPIDLSTVMCLDASGKLCDRVAQFVWTHTTTEGEIGIHGWCREHTPKMPIPLGAQQRLPDNR